MRRKPFLLSSLAALGVPAAAFGSAQRRADAIVTARTIHTMERASPAARAFAIRAGRFVYVGSREGAMSLRGPRTEIIEAGEATILPGLIDSHMHLTAVGRALHEVDLVGAASFDEVIRRTVAFAHTSPDTWITGEGWDQNLWPSKAFPLHEALSAAVPDRPVVLDRIDGHAVLANAVAMRMADVTASTPDPSGGRILRDSAGNATGVFIDNAMDVIYRAVPRAAHEQLVRWTRAAVREANRFGITAIGETRSPGDAIQAYEDVARSGDLNLRIHTMLQDDPDLIATYFAKGPLTGAYNGRLSIRAVKMFADGALGSRGAALLAPYSDDPNNVGLLRTTQSHIEDVTRRALARGFQVCVHAIGDRGNRMVLDAYERALQAAPPGDYRLRIEHAQVLSATDIARFKPLGIIPSMQSSHQISDMGWAHDRLGARRVRGAYAWRSLLDTGVIIANGTDAPVEAVRTLRTFHSAISRQNEANEPAGGWYLRERMTREEALQSMTIWAAHANFFERAIGSIAVGKYADFAIVDRDWMTVPMEAIMQTRILATYSAGRQVFDRTHGGAPVAMSPRRRGCSCYVPKSPGG